MNEDNKAIIGEIDDLVHKHGIEATTYQDRKYKVELMLGKRDDADPFLIEQLRTAYYVDKRLDELTVEDIIKYRNREVVQRVPAAINDMLAGWLYVSKECDAVAAIVDRSVPVEYRRYTSYVAQCFQMLYDTAQRSGIEFTWLDTVSRDNPLAYAEEFSYNYQKLYEAKRYLDKFKTVDYPKRFAKVWERLVEIYLSGDWNRHFELKGTAKMYAHLKEVVSEIHPEWDDVSGVDIATILLNQTTERNMRKE